MRNDPLSALFTTPLVEKTLEISIFEVVLTFLNDLKQFGVYEKVNDRISYYDPAVVWR